MAFQAACPVLQRRHAMDAQPIRRVRIGLTSLKMAIPAFVGCLLPIVACEALRMPGHYSGSVNLAVLAVPKVAVALVAVSSPVRMLLMRKRDRGLSAGINREGIVALEANQPFG